MLMKNLKILFLSISLLFIVLSLEAQYFSLPDSIFDDMIGGKYVLDSTYSYEWSVLNHGWMNTDRLFITERDKYGNQKRSKTIKWDEENSKWDDWKRNEQAYYDSLHSHFFIAFIYDLKAGDWKMSDSIFYNRKGKPEFSWFKVWDPDKYRFSRGKRVKFQYTSADLVSKEEIDIFDTISDNWKANQVVSYQYNEDRLLEVQQVKVWKDSGFWRDSLKITYSYNNQLQNISILQEKFNDNDFWENEQLTNKEFDENGNQYEVYKYRWNTTLQQWDNWNRYFYNYESNSLLIETVQQYWENDFQKWINLNKTIYEYNSLLQKTSVLQQFWDAFGNFWLNTSNYTYSYDDVGNRTGFLFRFWDEEYSEWLNIYKDANWWSFFDPSSISEFQINKVIVFPNPATSDINIAINHPFQDCYLTIYANDGQIVYSEIIKNSQVRIDISQFPKGVYILRLVIDRETTTGKIMVY